MEVAEFDYNLPASQIAQFPPAERTASRLLVLPTDENQNTESSSPLTEIKFSQIGNLLKPGDVLVANDTQVIAARIIAHKPSGGKVEIMLERILGKSTALVQLRANKPIRLRQVLVVGETELMVTQRDNGFFVIERCDHNAITTLFHSHGTTPLPPYISREAAATDSDRYQTVYSNTPGAVAAPTAGLHFDQPLIDALVQSGICWLTVTLHIGAGTFQPVRTETAEEHRMHREWIEIDAETCEQINQAKARGNRIIAVGTTAVRALESAAQASDSDHLQAFSGDTELFILPGYRFRVIDALITNFHLPRSTLLMMVCAFAGQQKIMHAYRHAIDHNFRFYSYGDAMFVTREAS